jgi:uncharacterized protein (DUF302 family)
MAHYSSQSISVSHCVMDLNVAFDRFVQALEQLAGRFDPAAFRQASDFESTQALIKRMEGEQGLMIFGKLDHGFLLAISGRPAKLLRYYIGNPSVAFSMNRHDVRAALYAPLSVLVYEVDAQTTRVEFDQPSTLFGQFGDPAVTAVGVQLDRKLRALIDEAAKSATVAR